MSVSIKNLSVGYRGKSVIRDISVEAQPGNLIALLGPNGSGKSTLIKALAGLLPALGGDIFIGDTPLSFLEPRERARQIAYLAQSRTAMPAMLVTEILELGRAPYRGRLGQISAAGQEAIGRAVDAADLGDYLSRPFGELSGGEQARVLLARALVVDAPVILADEPNAALDPYYQIETMKILKTEATRGKTVIAALHDLRLAEKFADQVWLMHEGELFTQGQAHRVLNAENLETVFRIDGLF